VALGLRGVLLSKRREVCAEARVITGVATIDELTHLDRVEEPE
jgi:hypothetical protein